MRRYRGRDEGVVTRSPRIRTVVPAAVLLAAWAVACGGESSASQTEAQAVDTCALLTATEIEEAIGQAPGDPVPKTLGETWLECRWPSADGSESQLAYVAYQPQGSPLTYDDWAEGIKEALGESSSDSDLEGWEQVTGIGDFALFADIGAGLGGQTTVFQDGRRLQVGTSEVRGTGTSNRDAGVTLARKAWARLP